ncbi:MAG: hypothetical protein FWD90_06810 [Defluviitaleaceae bacterium]|nr:hypothetical protein [Defluviitaleaceae bacterium]
MLNDLWVNNFLPVVEMAQERLVWVSLKLSMPNNNITNILAAIKNITTTEAQRLNISPLLTPCPKIIIIHHEGQGGWTYGTGDG